MAPPASFTWKDGERTIHFGRGALDRVVAQLGEDYALLTTPRASAMAPAVAERAGAVHEVGPGRVDELAGELLDVVDPGELIVALGGGRVIDTAKALAAARPPGARPRVAAIPTTLSAAEMTVVHRRAAGADTSLPGARPAIVVNDPALSASQPLPELAASAANALAHAAEGPATVRASPVPALAGREAARLIGVAYAGAGADAGARDRDSRALAAFRSFHEGDAPATRGAAEPDRDTLALAALLSGYTIDSAGYGLHHVLSQTLARVAGVGHGPSNAVMLPHTLVALEQRGASGAADLVALAGDLAARARASRLRDLGVDEATLDACADTAAERAELDHTPPRAGRDELRALYAAAY